VSYEWDPRKSASNARKHGVRFTDAVTVFNDDRAITIQDEHPEEERFVTIGQDAFGRLLVVVYAWRGESIRVISARKATPRERRAYGRH